MLFTLLASSSVCVLKDSFYNLFGFVISANPDDQETIIALSTIYTFLLYLQAVAGLGGALSVEAPTQILK